MADVDGQRAAGSRGPHAWLGERLLTPFEKALVERIRSAGAISVEAYMEACNNYYYETRDPLGAAGDFTTAPEISQMFGELVGAALADCWKRAGRPDNAAYAELGPGRGTLASDALRVMRSAGFAGNVHLVETSSALQEEQRKAIGDVRFHDSIEDLPDVPLMVAANEFFDALPVRQFVDGRERHVVAAAGGLAFDRDGRIEEISPARSAAAESLGRHLAKHGGAAIVVDYGHSETAAGDTLQAVRGHRYAPVLEKPGEQDLTAHVDFQALSEAAASAGAAVTPIVAQGAWLVRLGIVARAQALASAHPQRAEEIDHALLRLTDPEEMGQLFKVVAFHAPGWPAPAGL